MSSLEPRREPEIAEPRPAPTAAAPLPPVPAATPASPPISPRRAVSHLDDTSSAAPHSTTLGGVRAPNSPSTRRPPTPKQQAPLLSPVARAVSPVVTRSSPAGTSKVRTSPLASPVASQHGNRPMSLRLPGPSLSPSTPLVLTPPYLGPGREGFFDDDEEPPAFFALAPPASPVQGGTSRPRSSSGSKLLAPAFAAGSDTPNAPASAAEPRDSPLVSRSSVLRSSPNPAAPGLSLLPATSAAGSTTSGAAPMTNPPGPVLDPPGSIRSLDGALIVQSDAATARTSLDGLADALTTPSSSSPAARSATTLASPPPPATVSGARRRPSSSSHFSHPTVPPQAFSFQGTPWLALGAGTAGAGASVQHPTVHHPTSPAILSVTPPPFLPPSHSRHSRSRPTSRPGSQPASNVVRATAVQPTDSPTFTSSPPHRQQGILPPSPQPHGQHGPMHAPAPIRGSRMSIDGAMIWPSNAATARTSLDAFADALSRPSSPLIMMSSHSTSMHGSPVRGTTAAAASSCPSPLILRNPMSPKSPTRSPAAHSPARSPTRSPERSTRLATRSPCSSYDTLVAGTPSHTATTMASAQSAPGTTSISPSSYARPHSQLLHNMTGSRSSEAQPTTSPPTTNPAVYRSFSRPRSSGSPCTMAAASPGGVLRSVDGCFPPRLTERGGTEGQSSSTAPSSPLASPRNNLKATL